MSNENGGGMDAGRRSYPPGAILIPHPGKVDAELLDVAYSQQVPVGTRLLHKPGSQVPEQRNALLREALAEVEGCEWVCFIDADQVLPTNTMIRRFLDHGVPMVAPVILARGYPLRIANAFERLDPPQRAGLGAIPQEGLLPMAALGAGVLFIRRAAWEAVGDPWFRPGQFKPDALAEDIDFTSRAVKKGQQAYLDCGYRVGHATRVILWPGMDGRPWMEIAGAEPCIVPVRAPIFAEGDERA